MSESLSTGDLRIEVREEPPRVIRCVWRGKSNHRHPTQILSPFFDKVLTRAKESSLTVEMHFEDLDHFNSSTITSIIQLIQDARGRGVPLSLVYDSQLKWQKLSFDALRVFVKDDGLLKLEHAS